VNVIPSFHPCNKTYLLMVCHLFNMLLSSVSMYFIENFCIYDHQGYWPIISLFNKSLPGSSNWVILALYNEFVVFLPFVFYGVV
jgi:hypothetical protein